MNNNILIEKETFSFESPMFLDFNNFNKQLSTLKKNSNKNKNY